MITHSAYTCTTILYKYIKVARVQSVNISEFRANLLKYLDIANSGKEIMITSNGKQLATVSPPGKQKKAAKDQLKALSNTAVLHDIVSPIDSEWDAQS